MKRIAVLSALLLALVACKDNETPKPWNQDQFGTETTVSSAVRIDIDGRPMLPRDFNGDGVITGDIEMGS